MPQTQYAIVAAALADHPRKVPQLARAAGFIGILLDAFWSHFDVTALSQTGRRELRHLITSQNQQLVGICTDLGGKGLGPSADADRLLWQLDQIMESAAGLQSPLVCLDLGPLPAPPRQAAPKPQITPEQAGLIIIPTLTAAPAPESTTLSAIPSQVDPVFTSQVDGVLADLGRRADRYGVRLAFRSELSSFAALERALHQAACPWFGLDLDPAAVLRDEWSLDEIFSRLGPHLFHVRARDAIRVRTTAPNPPPSAKATSPGPNSWPTWTPPPTKAGSPSTPSNSPTAPPPP